MNRWLWIVLAIATAVFVATLWQRSVPRQRPEPATSRPSSPSSGPVTEVPPGTLGIGAPSAVSGLSDGTGEAFPPVRAGLTAEGSMLKIRVEDRWGGDAALWTHESRVLLIEGPGQIETVRRLADGWDAVAFAGLEPVALHEGPFLSGGPTAPVVIQTEAAGVPRLALIADPDSGLGGLLELEPGAAGERALVMDRFAALAVRCVRSDGQAVEHLSTRLRLGVSLASPGSSRDGVGL